MFDVITVGSATIDVFAKTDKTESISIMGPYGEDKHIAYPSGAKILITELDFMTGGGGTNTAACFSKFGLKTAYCGNIGKDENGNKVLSELKKDKVLFIGTRDKHMTNYSIVLDSVQEDRTILAYKGASEYLRFSKLDKKKLKAKWFYLCSMTGDAYYELEKFAEHAKKSKIKIAFNPSLYLAEKGIDHLKKLLSKTELIILNKEEAQAIFKTKDEPKILLKKLYSFGPRIVIITDGKNGSDCYDGKTYYHLLTRKVKVLETTGAGDAFASSFLTGYIKKGDITFALCLAQANVEHVITNYGPKKLLTWQQAIKKTSDFKHLLKKSLLS